MPVVFFSDPVTGVCALFDDPGGGGQWDSIDALCNRPAKDPVNWLTHIYFHSSFDYMEVAASPDPVSIVHGSIASYNDSPPAAPASGQSYRFSNYRPTAITLGDHLLVQHDLGYAPRFKVAINNEMIAPGFPVQIHNGVATRWVVPYATTSQIRLREIGTQQSTTVPAVASAYQSLVFANQPTPGGNVLFEFDPVTGIVTMGRGRFNSGKRFVQVVPGGSPFALSQGPTAHPANGAVRNVSPTGVIRESAPVGVRLMLYQSRSDASPPGDGGVTGYNGSFAGSPSIAVQAP